MSVSQYNLFGYIQVVCYDVYDVPLPFMLETSVSQLAASISLALTLCVLNISNLLPLWSITHMSTSAGALAVTKVGRTWDSTLFIHYIHTSLKQSVTWWLKDNYKIRQMTYSQDFTIICLPLLKKINAICR